MIAHNLEASKSKLKTAEILLYDQACTSCSYLALVIM